jgi:hypothetical protein
VKTKTHFAFRVDIWDDTGDSIVEHSWTTSRWQRRPTGQPWRAGQRRAFSHLIGNRASFLCTKAPMLRVPDKLSSWHSRLVGALPKVLMLAAPIGRRSE